MTDTTMTAVVDRWVMYTDASGNERPAHVVRETKIDGVTVLGVEAAGPGLVWVPIDRVIRSASTQLGLVPTDALNALAGTWPGDDTDEELAGAMRDWDGYITPQPTVTTHRCIPIARLAELEAAEARARELEAERDEARRSLDLSVRAWDTTGGPREGMLALIRRAEAAEAQLAALREAYERLADAVAYERLTHDGEVADLPGPGALGRLGTAEQMARCALTDATATAEAYTRRVRARALREAAEALEAQGPATDTTDYGAGLLDAVKELRAEAERIEGGS